MDQNGSKNIAYGTQCHNNNNVTTVNGSEPLSQESCLGLPGVNAQDPYTQLHRNIAGSKRFKSNVLFWEKDLIRSLWNLALHKKWIFLLV